MAFRITVAASYSAQPISRGAICLAEKLQLPIELDFTAYGQVFQTLLAPPPADLLFVPIRWSDWDDQGHNLEPVVDELSRYAEQARHTDLLIAVGPESEASESSRFADADARLAEKLIALPHVSLIVGGPHNGELASPSVIFDPVSLKTGHIPYTTEYFDTLAAQLVRYVYHATRPPVKVVVVDADNTLWNGVCGEVGPAGVVVEQRHHALQRRLLELKRAGVHLGLCSKNEPSDVWAVFEQVDGMLLGRSDFSTSRVNWDAKSQNIEGISAELGLNPESFVFIDDNPMEIAEVQSRLSGVTCLQMMQQSEQFNRFVDSAWPLDIPNSTDEDAGRTARYAQEQQRDEAAQRSDSLASFLGELGLELSLEYCTDDSVDRAVQLTERTNQFNTTGIHPTGQELTLQSTADFSMLASAKDRYGDYGRISLIKASGTDSTLTIDGWWLSCRALGRGVEFSLLKRLAEIAAERSFSRLRINLVDTDRNTPAQNFLRFLAAECDSEPDEKGVVVDVERAQAIDTIDCAVRLIQQSGKAPSNNNGVSHYRAPSAVLTQLAELGDGREISEFIRRQASPRPEGLGQIVGPQSRVEESVCQICADVLHLQEIGLDDAFADLGCGSLQIVQIHSRLARAFGEELSITKLYTLSTARDVVAVVEAGRQAAEQDDRSAPMIRQLEGSRSESTNSSGEIAVIGLAGRFPGADNARQMWENVKEGRSSITDIPESKLDLPPGSPLRSGSNLVRKSAGLDDPAGFDAAFFKIFPKEASLMDPQHRLLLEASWHAIEDAGYIPDALECSAGVFAGCYMNTYLLASLQSHPEFAQSLADSFHGGDLQAELGNDKDYLATRISFLLNLRGPALTIQTACSTSLVAIITACQSLRSRQCDFALAGGATLKLPQNRGYLYTEGGMVSPDGVVRTFDADARGTVFGEGVGMVALKRLEDAIRDGDSIYSVIKGCGINNDGHAKIGYTAPSVDGQRHAIELALDDANVDAGTITYVEAHGTGTSLGDPIEIDALTSAYRSRTSKPEKQTCAIGSLKTNIGHLDVAAGVAGLIKVSLAMRERVLPASLNFRRSNPNIDFENSPFYVNTKLTDWEPDGLRRAGLSSFGVGGTNAHIIVEEPPPQLQEIRPGDAAAEPTARLVKLSARSPEALVNYAKHLGNALATRLDLDIDRVAHTLNTGRKVFNYTAACVVDSTTALTLRLDEVSHDTISKQIRRGATAAWLFPGQGAQHPAMARDLFEHLPAFRREFDRCSDLLKERSDIDLVGALCGHRPVAAEALNQTSLAQPAIFAVSYSIAQCMLEMGIKPSHMVGHSVGEFVAATIAGVFSLEDALQLVAARGAAMQDLAPGSMLAVRMAESDLVGMLPEGVEIAAVNGPQLTVVSGPTEQIQQFEQALSQQSIVTQSLHTSHAFHSAMMEPAVERMRERLASVNLSPPRLEIVSTVTGRRLLDDQAVDVNYWAEHLRHPVRFVDAANTVLQHSKCVVEMGPGQSLSTLVRQSSEYRSEHAAFALCPHPKQATASHRTLLETLGKLWQAGFDFEDGPLFSGPPFSRPPSRVNLPGYPFEHTRYWFDDVVFEQKAGDETPSQGESAEGSIPAQQGVSARKSSSASPHAYEADARELIGDCATAVRSAEANGSVTEDRTAEANQGTKSVVCASAERVELEAKEVAESTPSDGASSIAQQVVSEQIEIMKRQLELWRQRSRSGS
ncbi:MAG TPA: hypothetical protein DDW52_28535 [Planctomycetaceae bacterium]|nr:hypothetical protein [Planctomycetaceae bacterium]